MQNSSSRLERLALLEKEREIFNQKQSSTLAIAGSFVGSSADLEQSAACFSQQDIRQNIKNIDGKHSYIEKSFKASSPTKKVNPWNRLVVNTEKSRIKYHGTDKTLIVLLEEERIKYTQLENEYHSLLNHVNELSASHSEAQTINAKEFEKQRKVMQEKIDKTRIEYSMLEQDFTRSIEKNKEQVFGLQKDKQNLENHVGRIKELLNESESQVSRLEKHDKEVSHQYDICKQKMIERDSTILKLNNASNQQELSRLKEKESLMKMEVRVLQLDHAFSNSRLIILTQGQISNLKRRLMKN